MSKSPQILQQIYQQKQQPQQQNIEDKNYTSEDSIISSTSKSTIPVLISVVMNTKDLLQGKYKETSPKKTRKRNRVPISCVICRRRKVKCDKQKPQCSNCIKNNVQHLCHYLEPKWAKPLDPVVSVNNISDNTFTYSTMNTQIPLTTLPEQQQQLQTQDQIQQQPGQQIQLNDFSENISSIQTVSQTHSNNNNNNNNNSVPINSSLQNNDSQPSLIDNSNIIVNNQSNILPSMESSIKIENQITSNLNFDESANLKKELSLLKAKMKNLETENNDLKKKLIITKNSAASAALAATSNSIRGLKNNDSDDLLDSIFNSNILFIAQKGNQHKIPITYQISVFSWMFVVKNDLYLNDLWMKILKLRQHYEFYYNSKSGATEKNLISHYRNYDFKLSKLKGSKNLNTSNLKSQIISQDKTSEHTSKLKKFLEKSLNLEKKNIKINKTQGNSNEIEVFSPPSSANNSYLQNVCPVTGVVGICPIGNSNPILPTSNSLSNNSPTDDKQQNHTKIETSTDPELTKKMTLSTTPTASSPLAQSFTTQKSNTFANSNQSSVSLKRKVHSSMKFNKCPVLHPSEAALSSPIAITAVNSYTKKLFNSNSVTTQDGLSDDDQLDDTKVCPLMVGDTKALFKEKLSKMNVSAIRESYNNTPTNNSTNNNNSNLQKKKSATASPAKSRGIPVIPSGPTTPMSEIKPEDTEKLNNFVPIAMKPESQPSLTSRQNSLKRQSSLSDNNFQSNNKKQKVKILPATSIKSLNYNNIKQVLSAIEQYLPSRKITTLLIDRFFDKLYIYMPYLDEHSFKIRVSAILKSSSDTTNNQKIKLCAIYSQYSEEFLTLCLLLIILRLSWLSLPDKSLNNLNQNELLLMKPENCVSFVLVDIVKEVFSNAKILTKPSLIIFQIGLYLKIYSTVSPEDGFDTDDSYTRNASYTTSNSTNAGGSSNNSTNPAYSQQQQQQQQQQVPQSVPQPSTSDTGTPDIPSLSSQSSNDMSGDLNNESPNMNSPSFISMLVQLARTIGLNRDPLNFKNFYPNANDDEITVSRLFKKRHLWRKLWFGLLFITIEANLSLGDYKKGLPIEIDLDPTLGSAINHSWDCRLPGGIEQGVLEKSFENGKILQRELCVVQNFRESIVSYRWIFKGMKLLFAVDKPPTTLEIENVVNKLNEIICEKSKYGFGIDLIMGDQEIVNPFRARNSSVWVKKYTKQIKVLRLKVHLIVKNMIFTLNYLMFLNHEQKLSKLLGQKNTLIEKIDKQRVYIERFFEASLLAAIENFKLFIQFMDDSNKVFPNCSNELLNYPFLMILNHRSHEFLISLVLRVQQSSPVIMEILKKNKIDPKELQKRLFTYLETFIERLDILTRSYYYAWVLKRMVKFFYNILTNSQKFFKLNFKRINQKLSPTTNTVTSPFALKKVPTNTSSSNNKTILNDNSNSAANGEKSAFEIAFGTSKLPPVTDFTHDDRREINFNPVIKNSDFILDGDNRMNINISNSKNLEMNMILANSNNVNFSNTNGLGIAQMLTPDNVSIDSSMLPPQRTSQLQQQQQNILPSQSHNISSSQAHMLPSSQSQNLPQPHIISLTQQQQDQFQSQVYTQTNEDHSISHTQRVHNSNINNGYSNANNELDQLSKNIFENMAADMKFSTNSTPASMVSATNPPTEYNQHANTQQYSDYSTKMNNKPNSGRWNNGFGEDLNEIFDDQFLNEIGGFAIENAEPSSILGLHRGLSNDTTLSPNNIHNMNQLNNFEDLEGSSLVTNVINNPTNGLAHTNSFTGDKGEIYNSLNEIDFTNVDLNAPIDNMVYGFELNMQDNNIANMGAALRGVNLGNNINTLEMDSILKMNGNGKQSRNMNDFAGSRSSSGDAQSGNFGQWNFF